MALLGLITPAYAQTQPDRVKVTEEQIAKKDNQVSVSMNLILDEMTVKGNDMVILTPVLKSNDDNTDSLKLASIVVAGGLRNKILDRKNSLGYDLPFDAKPQIIVKKEKNTSQLVKYNISVPYKPWMENASLSIMEAVSGCADCYTNTGDLLVLQNILSKKEVLPKNEVVSYELTFIVPEVEPVKARNDRHTATFNYIVDRYELLRNYKNNAWQFAEVDSIINEVKDDKNIQITEFTVAGYASPESGFEHNRILSNNRANSFANYLVSNFGITRNKFTVKGFGEDWLGLRKAVAASNLADKQFVLNIIDKVSNPDARDAELMKLSGGETYRTLLSNYYPPLRRTEYTIAYVVRSFDVEEAKQIIKTNPKLLSLYEMYLVAYTYPANSKEFKEVFDIAARLYPDSDIAIINSSAADIEVRNLDIAIERLKKIEHNPKVWNNLGVAYVLKGDTEKAAEYFTKAADNGDIDGKKNIETLKKVINIK